MHKCLVLITLLLVSAYSKAENNESDRVKAWRSDKEYKSPKASSYEHCITKGEEYYREIGSYPVLSNGKHAKKSAQEKCAITIGAFDSL